MLGKSFNYDLGKPELSEGEKQEILARGSGERAKTVDDFRKKRIEELRSLNPLPESKAGKELIRLQSENPNN